jgi:hypothetical protein
MLKTVTAVNLWDDICWQLMSPAPLSCVRATSGTEQAQMAPSRKGTKKPSPPATTSMHSSLWTHHSVHRKCRSSSRESLKGLCDHCQHPPTNTTVVLSLPMPGAQTSHTLYTCTRLAEQGLRVCQLSQCDSRPLPLSSRSFDLVPLCTLLDVMQKATELIVQDWASKHSEGPQCG